MDTNLLTVHFCFIFIHTNLLTVHFSYIIAYKPSNLTLLFHILLTPIGSSTNQANKSTAGTNENMLIIITYTFLSTLLFHILMTPIRNSTHRANKSTEWPFISSNQAPRFKHFNCGWIPASSSFTSGNEQFCLAFNSWHMHMVCHLTIILLNYIYLIMYITVTWSVLKHVSKL